jgi:hypothetical protein
MRKFTKNGVALLAGTVALAAFAGLAQAETRFAVQDSTGTTDKMVVTDTGYIGVGTSTPTTAIQARGGSIQDSQILSHYTGTDPMSSGGYLAYRNNLSGTTPILPKKGDRIGYTLFGSLASDGSPRNAAGLVGYAESDWTSASIPAYFLFEVAAPGYASRTERMRITSTGNVGIGTPTPTQKLEVNGNIRINTTTARPSSLACDSTVRGTIWLTQGSSVSPFTADTLEVCVKDVSNNYAWIKLY